MQQWLTNRLAAATAERRYGSNAGVAALWAGVRTPLPGMVGFRAACLVVLAAWSGAAFGTDKRSEVLGLWSGGDSILEVVAEGDTLRMDLLAIEDAVYAPGEPNGPAGAPRRDDNNPDETLRARPLQGINLVSDYAFSGSRWEGKIYDPESGKTYNSRMWREDGVLQMRGYVGLPMFGRTASFRPVDPCEPRTQALLNMIVREVDLSATQCNVATAR